MNFMSFESQHYITLRQYLASYLFALNKQQPSPHRSIARDKLTKLSKLQFSELSTDVFDELNRRQAKSPDLPFLQLNDKFHPKRNQARQKLATLPDSRFKDLASDVFYELERRFSGVLQIYYERFGDNDGTLSAGTNENWRPDNQNVIQNSNSLSSSVNQQQQLQLQQRTPSQQSNGQSDFGKSIDRVSQEYEKQLNDLEVRNLKLEEDNQRLINESIQLDQELDRSVANTHDLETRLDKSINDLGDLKKEITFLREENSTFQKRENEVRTEATNLLEEIKSLQKKNDHLTHENSRFKAQIEDLHRVGLNIDNGENVQDGVIDQNAVTSYQQAVDELLRAARSDTPTSVLVAMKQIVISCKNITEDAENFETSAQNNLQYDQRERLTDIKDRLSSALTNLMGSAKNHATSFGNLPVSILEGNATVLTATIVDIVELLQLKGVALDDHELFFGQADGQVFSIDQLKTFLEKQTDLIVQSIQNLLFQMRQNSSFGQEFSETVTGITAVVDHLVLIAHKTLSSKEAMEFRNRGEEILKDLSLSNSTLESLGESMINSPGLKSTKQKLASSSYEIAKYVKELISLIE